MANLNRAFGRGRIESPVIADQRGGKRLRPASFRNTAASHCSRDVLNNGEDPHDKQKAREADAAIKRFLPRARRSLGVLGPSGNAAPVFSKHGLVYKGPVRFLNLCIPGG